jgi:HPt (histidine-containing phosphotransfer) domain-containing protein
VHNTAFTANAFPEDVKACHEAGMNDFVVKPARKKALVEAIVRVLPEPRPATDRLPEHSAPPLALSDGAAAIPVAALDRDAFRELVREIGEQPAAEIHLVFIAETEARMQLLRGLSIERARTRIEREAHSLTSSAGTFGYRQLASLALQLVRDAPRLAEGEYRKLLDRIDTAYSSAVAQKQRC